MILVTEGQCANAWVAGHERADRGPSDGPYGASACGAWRAGWRLESPGRCWGRPSCSGPCSASPATGAAGIRARPRLPHHFSHERHPRPLDAVRERAAASWWEAPRRGPRCWSGSAVHAPQSLTARRGRCLPGHAILQFLPRCARLPRDEHDGLHAVALGNHDLDEGPGAWLGSRQTRNAPYLSANVFVNAEQRLGASGGSPPSSAECRRGARWIGGAKVPDGTPRSSLLTSARSSDPVVNRKCGLGLRSRRPRSRAHRISSPNAGVAVGDPVAAAKREYPSSETRKARNWSSASPTSASRPTRSWRGAFRGSTSSWAGIRTQAREADPGPERDAERLSRNADRAGGRVGRVPWATRDLLEGAAGRLRGPIDSGAARRRRGPRRRSPSSSPTPIRSAARCRRWCSIRPCACPRAGFVREKRRSAISSPTRCEKRSTRTSPSSIPAGSVAPPPRRRDGRGRLFHAPLREQASSWSPCPDGRCGSCATSRGAGSGKADSCRCPAFRLRSRGSARGTFKSAGELIDSDRTYRVATVDYLYDGGDGYTIFKKTSGAR